jgi:hypothetical protein
MAALWTSDEEDRAMSETLFSTLDNPRLDFAMEVRLTFPRVQTIVNTPMGGNRSAVYVDGGTFEGPRIKGKAVPGSGGDYAYFRPDDVAVFDARYMLEEEDGTLILLNNRGFLWGRKPDTMQRLRDWAFQGGAPWSSRTITCAAIRLSNARSASMIG